MNNNLKILVEKIDFNKVLSVPIWGTQDDKSHFKKNTSLYREILRIIVRVVYKSIFTVQINKKLLHDDEICFYLRAHSRSDLDEHSEKFEQSCDVTTTCIIAKRKKVLDFKTLFLSFIILWKTKEKWGSELSSAEISLYSAEGLNVFFTLFDSLSDFLKIMPDMVRHSKLVSFQEMVPVENIACQFANAIGMPTFALQHALGAYSETGSYESCYSRVHYAASVSSKILVWGEYTKKTFERFTDSEVFIIGKPVLPKIDGFAEGVTFIFEADDQINDKLLELADGVRQLGIEVSYWFRPGHKLVRNGVVRDGPLRIVIIGWRSSLLVELGYMGGNVFVIPDSVFCENLPSELVVDNAEKIYRKCFSLESYPNDVWKGFIECTGEESIEKYKFILHQCH